jgi:SHS2 domain-containing protein
MERFERLDHTADVGFRAWGPTLEVLFENAAAALVDVAMDASRAEAADCLTVTVQGESPEDLLVNWLNEVVWLLDGKRLAPARFRVQLPVEGLLQAEVWGEPRDDSRHPPRLVVKGATWHGLRLERQQKQWTAEVILDV